MSNPPADRSADDQLRRKEYKVPDENRHRVFLRTSMLWVIVLTDGHVFCSGLFIGRRFDAVRRIGENQQSFLLTRHQRRHEIQYDPAVEFRTHNVGLAIHRHVELGIRNARFKKSRFIVRFKHDDEERRCGWMPNPKRD